MMLLCVSFIDHKTAAHAQRTTYGELFLAHWPYGAVHSTRVFIYQYYPVCWRTDGGRHQTAIELSTRCCFSTQVIYIVDVNITEGHAKPDDVTRVHGQPGSRPALLQRPGVYSPLLRQ